MPLKQTKFQMPLFQETSRVFKVRQHASGAISRCSRFLNNIQYGIGNIHFNLSLNSLIAQFSIKMNAIFRTCKKRSKCREACLRFFLSNLIFCLTLINRVGFSTHHYAAVTKTTLRQTNQANMTARFWSYLPWCPLNRRSH